VVLSKAVPNSGAKLCLAQNAIALLKTTGLSEVLAVHFFSGFWRFGEERQGVEGEEMTGKEKEGYLKIRTCTKKRNPKSNCKISPPPPISKSGLRGMFCYVPLRLQSHWPNESKFSHCARQAAVATVKKPKKRF
jgi:hypothetical protein